MNKTDGLRITIFNFLNSAGHIQLFEYNTRAGEATLSERKTGVTKHHHGSMTRQCRLNMQTAKYKSLFLHPEILRIPGNHDVAESCHSDSVQYRKDQR